MNPLNALNPVDYFFTNSTRLFCARPSSVLLSATGFESPRPAVVSLVAEIPPGEDVAIYLCEQRSLLATLPETTFFSRYRETFSS